METTTVPLSLLLTVLDNISYSELLYLCDEVKEIGELVAHNPSLERRVKLAQQDKVVGDFFKVLKGLFPRCEMYRADLRGPHCTNFALQHNSTHLLYTFPGGTVIALPHFSDLYVEVENDGRLPLTGSNCQGQFLRIQCNNDEFWVEPKDLQGDWLKVYSALKDSFSFINY